MLTSSIYVRKDYSPISPGPHNPFAGPLSPEAANISNNAAVERFVLGISRSISILLCLEERQVAGVGEDWGGRTMR